VEKTSPPGGAGAQTPTEPARGADVAEGPTKTSPVPASSRIDRKKRRNLVAMIDASKPVSQTIGASSAKASYLWRTTIVGTLAKKSLP